MKKFMKNIKEPLSKSKVDKVGLTVDVSQLYTSEKRTFLSDLKEISAGDILGWHIHYRHRPPSLNDRLGNVIGWKQIVELMGRNTEASCLPEVHTGLKGVEKTINFVERIAAGDIIMWS